MDNPEYWRHDYYSRRLNLINGSPKTHALARESYQLIHELESFLRAMRFRLALDTISVRDAMLTLRVHLTGDSPVAQLQAFVKLVRHSIKLDAWPDVKTAFWLTISQMQYAMAELTQQLAADPAFPRFLLCIGSRPRDRPRGAGSMVSAALCDAVFDVLTTPVGVTVAKPSLELSFGTFEPRGNFDPKVVHTHEQMELIERMLDRLLLRNPTLQFTITTLDFTNIMMDLPQVQVQKRIVAKCKSGAFQIQQIKMDADTLLVNSAFPDLASSASSVDSLPRFVSLLPPSNTPTAYSTKPSILEKVSLTGNVVTPNFFPVHFSTLRYATAAR